MKNEENEAFDIKMKSIRMNINPFHPVPLFTSNTHKSTDIFNIIVLAYISIINRKSIIAEHIPMTDQLFYLQRNHAATRTQSDVNDEISEVKNEAYSLFR